MDVIMGFQFAENVYKLTFDDPDMAGFECRMREVSVLELLDISELLGADPRQIGTRERVHQRTDRIAECIIGWNLEDADGHPIEVSAAAILAKPQRFNVAITAAWLREVVGLTAPPATSAQTSDSSPDGLDSLVMEDLPEQV